MYTKSPEDTRRAMAEEGSIELPFHFDFDGAAATEFR